VTDTPTSMQPLVVDGLSVTLGRVRVLDGYALSVGPREHLCIVGPSGSGKSTLLRCVAGLIAPDAGRIVCDGVALSDVAARIHVAPESRRIGMVAQHPALWPHLSARKHLLTVLRWRGVARDARRAEAERLLELVRIAHRADHRPSELSGGEAQRLALARALCGGSRILLLDEPLGQLDAPLRRDLGQELAAIVRAAKAIVLHVTHDPEEAERLADRVVRLEPTR